MFVRERNEALHIFGKTILEGEDRMATGRVEYEVLKETFSSR